MRGKQLYLFGSHKDSEKRTIGQRVNLHLDTLILSSVIGILALTLSFSLGVEKGKKIALSKLNPESEPAGIDQNKIGILPVEEATRTEINNSKPANSQSQNAGGGQQEEKEEKKQKIYNIQVACFYKDQTAQRAAKNLQERGFPVLVKRKGKYAVVYVGGFDDEVEAKSSLKVLRKEYKDCILRKLVRGL